MINTALRRFDPYEMRECGRARLRPGHDVAVGTASTSAVQTELDPPPAQVKPFEIWFTSSRRYAKDSQVRALA